MANVYDTYRIVAMAVNDTASTALPALPAIGNLITWAGAGGGWAEVDFQFSDDPFDFEPIDENALEIKPPAMPAVSERIYNAEGLRQINFTAYEFGQKCYQYATNISSQTGGNFIFQQTHGARKAVAIEYGKVGVLYMPSCEIKFDIPVGGIWTLGTHVGHIVPYATTGNNTGYSWQHLQSASG